LSFKKALILLFHEKVKGQRSASRFEAKAIFENTSKLKNEVIIESPH